MLRMYLLLLLATAGAKAAAPVPSMTYQSNAFLDEAQNIRMYWNHDADTITIELHAKTVGYVAVGFSPAGKMEGGDIIIGWVKEGKAILQDRYAVGNMKPTLDAEKNVELLTGKEEDGYTILKFKRKLDTCDPDHDRAIPSGTVKMIWAIGDTDPHDEEGIYYHNARGQRNIQLLGVIKKAIDLPADSLSYEFRNKDYAVPSDDTTYACQVLRMPKVDKKHHMIQFEPIIKKGHEGLVHHILIYGCTAPSPINDTHEGQQFFCHKNHGEMPWFRWHCEHVIMTWAVGGEIFYFPEHVGFSIGTEFDPDFMIMETHYDNPNLIAGQVDDSGIRIHYTPTLRTYDAGVLDQGKVVDTAHFIPPKSDAWKSYGYCNKKCLNHALEDTPEKQLNVFAVMLHAHLLGVGIKTWHVRDGIELPPIAEDKYYDFNYQTVMTLPEERAIKQNDLIATECTYRSTGRENITYGGLSSRQEMCITFMYYWPRMNMSICSDRTSEWSTYPVIGIWGVGSDGKVTAPPENVNKTPAELWQAVDWSNAEIRTKFEGVEQYGLRTPLCRFMSATGGYAKYQSELFNFTAPTEYYEEPKVKCPAENAINGAGRIETRMLTSIFVAIVIFVASI
ncbi:DBH-like monooxygenase protein 1 homolog [Lineus longissimus]|uniref:DBH-like monooxygenase protein 1 homolog n=1 Tax=Lineus longissimus TaxID=88925 RepID=UPI002B4CE5A0